MTTTMVERAAEEILRRSSFTRTQALELAEALLAAALLSPVVPADQDRAAVITEYVVGFAFDTDGRVALIRKNRPAWQAGRLNGIGGHVEPTDKTPWGAMCREWCEETGQPTPANWREFVVMDFPGARIHFFTALGLPPWWLDACHTTTDEEVCLVTVSDANQHLLIPNLRWLIPLAAYTADNYELIHVHASMAELIDAPEHATPPTPTDEGADW